MLFEDVYLSNHLGSPVWLIKITSRQSHSLEQFGLDVNINISGNERRLEPYLEVMIFRALQELLGNAARHSQGTLLKLNVDLTDDLIRVSVDDNGKGFDLDAVQNEKSLGIKLIRERTEMLGGTFTVDSAAGKGTRIMFSLPARK